MSAPPPTLYMLCGKISAGKSTLAAKLAAADKTVLIGEDEWLAPLFSEELHAPKDYVRSAAKLRVAMTPHILTLLNTGLSVVLDFQANTVESRTWMKALTLSFTTQIRCDGANAAPLFWFRQGVSDFVSSKASRTTTRQRTQQKQQSECCSRKSTVAGMCWSNTRLQRQRMHPCQQAFHSSER